MSDFKSVNSSYICFDEVNTKKMNIIDDKFRNVALSFGAVEYHIPAMIDQYVLSKCGYFTKFPQHLTIAAHARRDSYKQISDRNQMSDSTVTVSQQDFTPAACLHIYPMLENQVLSQKVITTKARVYRYEDEKFNGNTRLWDFTVREIVFIGQKHYVLDCLDQMKMISLDYTKEIGLSAKMCSAFDSFYPTKRNAVKQKLQLSNSLKCELNVKIGDNDVAISSFNYHETHFSKSFHFDNDGEIVTGCVGFGLERWVTAINFYNIEL